MDYTEQVNRLWDEWMGTTGQESGDPDEFLDWAITNKKLAARPLDIRKVLRRSVTQALRAGRRYDIDGCFHYRSKQSVTLFDGELVMKHYFDTDTGGSPTLRQKAVRQRREGIANDVYRAVCDVEHMNRVFEDEPRLNFLKDFTDDVAEKRASDGTDDEGDAS